MFDDLIGSIEQKVKVAEDNNNNKNDHSTG